MRYLIVASVLVLMTACSRQPREAAQDETPGTGSRVEQGTPERTTVLDDVGMVIDAATGVQAIEQGEKAKHRLQRLQEERNRQLEDFGDQQAE